MTESPVKLAGIITIPWSRVVEGALMVPPVVAKLPLAALCVWSVVQVVEFTSRIRIDKES